MSLIEHLEAVGLKPIIIDEDTKFPTTTLSPFLPETFIQYAWDSTSLGYLKRCPRLYQYIMIEGWTSNDESIDLRFGREYHKALENYDKSKAAGIPHEDSVFDVTRQLLVDTNGWNVDTDTKKGRYKNRNSLLRTVLDYLDHFRDDPAATYIKADGEAAVELSFRFELDWGPKTGTYGEGKFNTPAGQPYLLCGHLDRVVVFQDEVFVMDRKTTTTTPGSYFFDRFEPDNQMSLYSFASRIILNSPIKGVIIDAAQILANSSRFVRGFTLRTADQLEEWVHDLHYWFNLAESFALAAYWPQNDTSCDKYGGCPFRGICSKSPGVRQQYLKSTFKQLPLEERWNPLKPR